VPGFTAIVTVFGSTFGFDVPRTAAGYTVPGFDCASLLADSMPYAGLRHAELLATGLRAVCFKAVRSNGVVVKKDKGDEFSSGKKLAYTNGYGYSPARPLMTAPPRVTPTGPGRP
jgi:hypothetical protein